MQLPASARLGAAVDSHHAREQELPGIGPLIGQGRQLQQLPEADHVALDFDVPHLSIVSGSDRTKIDTIVRNTP